VVSVGLRVQLGWVLDGKVGWFFMHRVVRYYQAASFVCYNTAPVYKSNQKKKKKTKRRKTSRE